MINRIKTATLIFGALLVSLIASSLWMNYRAQMALRRSATRQFCHDGERQAVNLEYFFTERKDDLRDLANSREISVFFENQALGMSMAYGLQASLMAIAKQLEHVIATKRFYDSPIYTRLLFLDASGTVLVDIDPMGHVERHADAWARFRLPNTRRIFVFEAGENDAFEPIISAGYFFKGKYAGQLVAVLAKEILFDHLLKPESEDAARHLGLVCRHRLFHDIGLHGIPFPAEPVEGGDAATLIRIDPGTATGSRAIFDKPSLAVQVPVKGTPFSSVIVTPVSALFGDAPPWHLPMIMGMVTLAIIGGMGVLWQLNTRNTVLNTRLEETAKRERVIKRYQENLERLVEERTRDLKAAQDRLINRAMEAGREQLSAMVLHNIGNAMTPLGVFMSSLRDNDVGRRIDYLMKSYRELNAHADDLPAFLTQNTRGREVFDFMGHLIEDLDAVLRKNRQTEVKINASIGYISEIISMQQAYAASSHEVKRRIDLNRLVEDAIQMQAGALENRGITVETVFQSPLPPLVIDKTRLMQVLVNIIKNGYEAMDQLTDAPAEKRMHFTTYGNAGCIGLTVEDSGIGVDPGMADKLFDMGHSGKGSSGFGLYYCKIFAEANHGSMSIKSAGVGQGALVRIEFPRSPSGTAKTPPPTADVTDTGGKMDAPCGESASRGQSGGGALDPRRGAMPPSTVDRPDGWIPCPNPTRENHHGA